MMKYKTSEDNKDYIVMEDPIVFLLFLKNNYYSGSPAVRNAHESYKKFRREHASEYEYKDLAIKKDSDLGKYICDERTGLLFENLDETISYEDVVNAYNISFISENPIVPTLKDMVSAQVYGKTKDIRKICGDDITDYILDNKDFFRYVKIRDGKYNPRDSLVYDGTFHRDNLYKMNKGKQKVK